jgi:hypothetical protein
MVTQISKCTNTLPSQSPTSSESGSRGTPRPADCSARCSAVDASAASSSETHALKPAGTSWRTPPSRTFASTGLKIPVSGVQFSPCPPFFFDSSIVPTHRPDCCSGSNGVSCFPAPSAPTRKTLDRLALMGRAQMRVSLRHHQRLVAKDLLDRVEVHAAHDQATRRRVPEVVEPEIGDLGVLHRLCPRPAEVVEELPSRRGEHHAAKDLPCFAQSLERLDDDAVHRYPTPLT